MNLLSRRQCTVPLRHENLGWVVQAGQAVMAARKMIPPDIKKKLDQFSVGHQIMKLFKSKTPKASQVWKEYVPIAGQVLGSEIDPVLFEEAFKGMWDTGQSDLGGVVQKYRSDRAPIERFKADILDVLARAVIDGRIAGTVTAPGVYQSIVLPWLATMNVSPVFAQSSGWAGSGLGHPRYELMVALVDRMLHDQRTGRNDLEHYQRENAPYLKIPKLTDRAAELGGGTSAVITAAPSSGVMPVQATPSTVAPPAIAVPAPLPPGPASIIDVQAAVRDIMNSIISSPAAANLTQQQIADAVSATAFKWLQGPGVPTNNATVQTAVSTEVKRFDWQRWAVPAGITAVAGIGAYFLFRRRRGRSAMRS